MTSETVDNEQLLVRRAKEGDTTALRAVYKLYVRYLTAVCSRYITNSEDVKDILQDSFLKIFSTLDTYEYRGVGTLKNWLAKIVVNETLKFINKNNRLEFTDLAETADDIADEEPDLDCIPSQDIFDMIRQLPDGYRTIFNLYVIEGKSHKEISTLLNIGESTSASQLHRAKTMLAAKIRQFQNAREL